MENFPGKFSLRKLTQEEIEDINYPKTLKEIKVAF